MIIATAKWRQQVMTVRGASLIRPSSSKSFTPEQEHWLIANGYATSVHPDQIITSLPETRELINSLGDNSLEEEQDAQTEADASESVNEQGNEQVKEQDNEPEPDKRKRSRKL